MSEFSPNIAAGFSSSEKGVFSAEGMGAPLGKRIGKCFPPAAGNGRNLARNYDYSVLLCEGSRS